MSDTGATQPPETEAQRIVREQKVLQAARDNFEMAGQDPWIHRSQHMMCHTCMWFVEKRPQEGTAASRPWKQPFGRCRRHSPTMSGYPAVFGSDWCGDHKVDENKIQQT